MLTCESTEEEVIFRTPILPTPTSTSDSDMSLALSNDELDVFVSPDVRGYQPPLYHVDALPIPLEPSSQHEISRLDDADLSMCSPLARDYSPLQDPSDSPDVVDHLLLSQAREIHEACDALESQSLNPDRFTIEKDCYLYVGWRLFVFIQFASFNPIAIEVYEKSSEVLRSLCDW